MLDKTIKKRQVNHNERSRRVTMTDIAREAGCSQSTVSFVLNNNRSVKISETTRRRVTDVAKRLKYNQFLPRTTNPQARPVRHGRVAFVIDSLSTSPEGIVMIQGIRRSLEPTKTMLVIAETGNDPELEPLTIRSFIDDGVEAIIYACIFTRTISVPELLKDCGVPVLLLNCVAEDLSLPAVVPSEIAGGHRATQALIDAGHIRIATIMGEDFMDAAQDRLSGYRRALASADIPFDPNLVVGGDWSASAGYRGAAKLMALKRPPSAIFCQNDRMAIGCYEFLKEKNYSIPRDCSVVGYDDEEIARHLSPPLTTVILPHRDMGRWTIEQYQHGTQLKGSQILPTKLECTLVERQSIAAPGPK